MNWLQKIAVQRRITQWTWDVMEAMKILIPGNWQIWNWSDLIHDHKGKFTSSYIGRDIRTRPGALFHVIAKMERINVERERAQHFDSDIGHKGVTFECEVWAMPRAWMPERRKKIGQENMLDTPNEIAEYVQLCIENYRPLDDDENDDNDLAPDPPPIPTADIPDEPVLV